MTRELPTNPEAEAGVVAGVLRSGAIHQLEFLRESDFADKMLGAVYGAVRDLTLAGRPADWRVVAGLFEGRAERAGKWMRDLMATAAPPESAISDVARSVRDLADRRRLIVLAEEMAEAAHVGGKPAAEMAAHWAASIATEIGESDDAMQPIGRIGERVTEGLNVKLPCSATGIVDLDRSLAGGLYAGKLYGIVARMKQGKTMLMSTLAMNAAEKGARVLYLPLEMGAEELVQRLMARRMGVNSLAFLDERRRSARDFQMEAGKAAVGLNTLPLFFQTKPRMALDSIRQLIARAAMRDSVQGVIIDYLQLITGQQRNQSQAGFLDEITQALAEACKSWGIWIMIAAQENQQQNVRGGEGLLNACDLTLRLHRLEPVIGSKNSRAWLEMMVSRYTIRRHVGSEEHPALLLDTRAGPAFVEIEQPGEPGDVLEER